MAFMRISKGILYMMGAALLFSIMSLLVKLIGERLPSVEVVFVRNAISLVITGYMLYQAGISPWGQRRGLLLVRGFAGFFALLCFFYAIPRLPLAEVTVLHFTYPLFVALLAPFVLKEAAHAQTLVALVFCVGGLVLVTQPDLLFARAGSALNPIVVGVALLSALLTAVAYLSVRELRTTEHYLVVILYFPMVSIPASVPLLIGNLVWPTWHEWLLLIGVGLTTQGAQVCLTKGLNAETASRATSITYVQIVFAGLLGWLFFGEFPNILALAGMILLTVGIYITSKSQ